MKIRFVLVALSLVWTGMASAATTTCNQAICPLVVTVTTNGDGKCTGVSVDKPDLYVAAGVAPVLIWTINSTSYSFDTDGIVFDPNNTPPPTDFQAKHWAPYQVLVVDAHHQAGKFKYSVKVQGCPPLDPFIHN